MEQETQETTQVNEEPAEQQVDLTGVEIVSNGEKIDTDTNEDTKQTTETEEDNNNNKAEEQEDKEPETPVEQTDFDKAKAEQEEAKTTLSAKGIDYAKLEAEYNSEGGLSKKSYEELEKAGYPKTVVDAITAGWQAKTDAFANKIIEDAGGKREYSRITKFVSDQGRAAVRAFNDIVQNSDLNVVSAYITGIKAQMVAKYGTSNPTLAGNTSASTVKGYEDANEMVKAMSDPRYGKDTKYTKSVEDKVAKSTFF